MDLGTLIPRHARYTPHRLAVVFEEHRYTWREFESRVHQTAQALLGMGLRKGDKIATLLPNSIELLDLFWAVAHTGMVIVPLSPLLRGAGLVSLLNDSDARLIVTTGEMLRHLVDLREQLVNIKPGHIIVISEAEQTHNRLTREVLTYSDWLGRSDSTPPPASLNNDDDLYNIIYSSGTTGLPKGIMHTHYIRGMYCQGFAALFRIAPESVILHTGSLVFNGAFLTFMPAFYQGATYILHPHFDVARLVATVEREQVTHMMMVPSQIVAMLHAPDFDPKRMRSIEMILTVGAPLHIEHKKELNERLPGVFYELYGLTEGFVTVLDKLMYSAKPQSVGVPPPFYEMKIVNEDGVTVPAGEVGEIVGRGPILMAGYYKRPDLTAQAVRDGWLYTGDLGYVDDDGFLFLVDRKKDMIITGGVNVYPRDIEEIVVQHPDVVEAAVFGVPDEKWGETPVAAVIMKPQATTSAEALCEWVNERVTARYQKLHTVIIRDSFPRSVAGKTLKRVMRDEFWQNAERKI